MSEVRQASRRDERDGRLRGNRSRGSCPSTLDSSQALPPHVRLPQRVANAHRAGSGEVDPQGALRQLGVGTLHQLIPKLPTTVYQFIKMPS